MKYIVRLKTSKGPEEYYFEEYKDAQAFMQRCGGLDADFIRLSVGPFDHIKVQTDCLFKDLVDSD